MANIRLIYNDAVTRAATIVASTTAGSLAASNVATNLKSQVWRSTTNSSTLTFTWTVAESVSGIAIPFCGMSGTSTIRVQGYTNVGDPTAVVDSGTMTGGTYIMPQSVGLPTGVNSFGQGGARQWVVYIPTTAVKQLVITFNDSSASYIEVGKVVIGPYWESSVNVPYGAVTMGMGDDSKHTRSDAGDVFTDVGPRYKTLDLNFQYLPTTDRDNLWRILRGNGMATPVFIDVVPGTTDAGDEFIYSIYGKLAKSSSIVMTMFNQYASTLSWTEI